MTANNNTIWMQPLTRMPLNWNLDEIIGSAFRE
jgi:hypothetical protein